MGRLITGLVAGCLVSGVGSSLAVNAAGSSTAAVTVDTGHGADTSGGNSSAAVTAGIPSGDEPASANSVGSCAGGWTQVLDITTDDGQATVCENSSQQYDLAATFGDNSPINVDADSDDGEYVADDGDTSYHVDPDFVAVYTDGQLTSDDAATGASVSGAASDEDASDRLADLVQLAHDGRVRVERLSSITGECGASSRASALITRIVSNRQQVLAAARHLPTTTGTLQTATELFASAMQGSLRADDAFSRWISDGWAPWDAAGCHGSASASDSADYDELKSDSALVDRVKRRFIKVYDPLAATDGLTSSWHGTDI